MPLSLRMKLITLILLMLGVAALAAGQALSSAVHWLGLAPNSFDSLHDLSCGLVPVVCQMRYPSYFALVLILVLVALVLLGLALRRSALAVTNDVGWTTAITEPHAWNRLTLALAVVALIATIWMVITGLTSPDHFPSLPSWLAAIVLWAVVFYSIDRLKHHAPVLTRHEFAQFICYILLLIALGFVFHLPVLHEATPRIVFVLVASLIPLVLWRVRRISGVSAVFIIIAIAGVAIYTYNLDTWHYAFIGDEYAFYNTAANFFRAAAQVNILDPKGVYDSHPVFATMVQALSLSLYGGDIYSWRINGPLMALISAAAIYLLVRQLKSSNAGLLAAVIFATGHHLLGFSHPGYFALQILPGLAGMLALAVLALQRRSWLAIFLCGVAASFTFYTYTLAIPLIPLPLILIGLWAIWPTRARPLIQRIAAALPLALIFVLAMLITSSPRILNTGWISDAASNTLLSHSEIPNMTNPLLQQILPNIGYTLGATLYFDVDSHYVSGQNIDPVSDMLMIAGIAGLIAVATRRRVALWLLISFLALVTVIGGSTPYPYPPHSRTFTLLIFYSIFAALGASYLWETVREAGLRLSPAVLRLGAAVIALLVVALNLYQFFDLAPKDIPQTTIAMMVREFEVNPPSTTFYYAARIPNDDNMLMVLNGFREDTSRLHPVMSPVPELALSAIQREAQPPYRIIFAPDLPNYQDWLDLAQKLWPDHPLQPVIDENRVTQFQVIDVQH